MDASADFQPIRFSSSDCPSSSEEKSLRVLIAASSCSAPFYTHTQGRESYRKWAKERERREESAKEPGDSWIKHIFRLAQLSTSNTSRAPIWTKLRI